MKKQKEIGNVAWNKLEYYKELWEKANIDTKEYIINELDQLMEYKKTDMSWSINEMEKLTDRYIEAERMIIQIIDMPWWKRLFCKRKLLKFLKSRDKYYF